MTFGGGGVVCLFAFKRKIYGSCTWPQMFVHTVETQDSVKAHERDIVFRGLWCQGDQEMSLRILLCLRKSDCLKNSSPSASHPAVSSPHSTICLSLQKFGMEGSGFFHMYNLGHLLVFLTTLFPVIDSIWFGSFPLPCRPCSSLCHLPASLSSSRRTSTSWLHNPEPTYLLA